MGMSWVIGYNPSLPKDQRWQEVYVNSTTDMYLSTLLSDALEHCLPGLYSKLTEQSGCHFIHFDELSKEEFKLVTDAIHRFLNSTNQTAVQKKCVELWISLLLPLFELDERNAA